MVEVTDSGFTPENIADAEWLWTNLPTFPRNWSSLPTHEKALIVHTAARHRIEAAKAEHDRLPSPFGALREAINSDPDYAWSWLCNLAVPIMDSTGVTHEIANQAAALIMAQMFDCDITKHPNFEYAKSPQQGYFEARIASERNSNGGQP